MWNHAPIGSWNQPILSNERKLSCSRKQRGPSMGLEPTTSTLGVRRLVILYPWKHIYCMCWFSFPKCALLTRNHKLWELLYVVHNIMLYTISCCTQYHVVHNIMLYTISCCTGIMLIYSHSIVCIKHGYRVLSVISNCFSLPNYFLIYSW